MADNYILGQPDLAEQLFRILGLRGDLPRELLPELRGTIRLDDFTLPEYQWDRRTSRFQQGTFVAAVAGQLASVSLVAPATQRLVGVVERIIVANANAAAQVLRVDMNWLAPTYATTTSGAQYDDRLRSPANSVLRFGGGAQVARIVTRGFFLSVPAGGTVVLDFPFVLTGTQLAGVPAALTVEADIVNTSVTAGFTWRERVALQSEL